MAKQVEPVVRSLILCDRIYRDGQTNKFVLAGTFNHLQAPSFPWTFPGGCSLYCAVTGIHSKTTLVFAFLEASSETILMEAHLEVQTKDPLTTAEINIELPPLPLPKPGPYLFRLSTSQGTPLLELPLTAVLRQAQGPTP